MSHFWRNFSSARELVIAALAIGSTVKVDVGDPGRLWNRPERLWEIIVLNWSCEFDGKARQHRFEELFHSVMANTFGAAKAKSARTKPISEGI
jgi:hypothetical protein